MVVESAVLERPAPGIQAVAVGSYTEIVDLITPSEARAGDEVTITATVKNIGTYPFYIHVGGRYDGTEFEFSPHSAAVGANGVYSFSGSFIMPNHDVRVHVWSYYWTGSEWVPDDYDYVDVRLVVPVGWQPLATTTLSLWSAAPPVVGWQPLASRTIGVASAAPPVVGWQPLASRTIGVSAAAPPPTGWQPLGTPVTVSVAAGPFPPWWELIHEQIYHWGYVYRGDAEVCNFTFKFPPEQIPGVDWMTKKLVEVLASTLEDHDSKLLELKLWRDTRPVMWTDYKCEVTASASPLVWWAILAIICGIIIAINFLIREIRKTFFEPHGLPEEVKAEYSRETLIRMICETPPEQTPETLEGMSDDELRDLLNQKLAVAAPKGWPWYMWLGITGIGIAGSLVAVTALRAFAPKKK